MNIGDEVVCIDDNFGNLAKYFSVLPVKDNNYIIRSKKHTPYGTQLLLEGLINPPIYIAEVAGKMEPGFNSSRFRPVIKQTETIKESIYQEI
jgi:hypothetical protein